MIVRVGNFVILALQNYTKLSINYKITIKTNPPMTEFRRFSIHKIMIFFWVPFISPISFIQKDELVNGFPYWENLGKPGVYIFASTAASWHNWHVYDLLGNRWAWSYAPPGPCPYWENGSSLGFNVEKRIFIRAYFHYHSIKTKF